MKTSGQRRMLELVFPASAGMNRRSIATELTYPTSVFPASAGMNRAVASSAY